MRREHTHQDDESQMRRLPLDEPGRYRDYDTDYSACDGQGDGSNFGLQWKTEHHGSAVN